MRLDNNVTAMGASAPIIGPSASPSIFDPAYKRVSGGGGSDGSEQVYLVTQRPQYSVDSPGRAAGYVGYTPV